MVGLGSSSFAPRAAEWGVEDEEKAAEGGGSQVDAKPCPGPLSLPWAAGGGEPEMVRAL